MWGAGRMSWSSFAIRCTGETKLTYGRFASVRVQYPERGGFQRNVVRDRIASGEHESAALQSGVRTTGRLRKVGDES